MTTPGQILEWPAKDPAAIKDYGLDWTDWLAGDELTTSTWESEDDDLELSDDTLTTTTATVFIAGGQAGQNYTVINTVTTDGGRTDVRRILLPVRET